jgi:hypothetical protein
MNDPIGSLRLVAELSQDSHPRRAEVTQRYVDMLEAIDALHQPNWHDNSGRDPMWCDTCCVDWPCSTHLLIHKEP